MRQQQKTASGALLILEPSHKPANWCKVCVQVKKTGLNKSLSVFLWPILLLQSMAHQFKQFKDQLLILSSISGSEISSSHHIKKQSYSYFSFSAELHYWKTDELWVLHVHLFYIPAKNTHQRHMLTRDPPSSSMNYINPSKPHSLWSYSQEPGCHISSLHLDQ